MPEAGAPDPTDPAREEHRSSSTPPAARSILRVESLSKTFPGTKALSDVGIDVKAGQAHALVGHNGSGKSTLIKVLSGYHQPDPGAEAWLDGEPVDVAALGHGRHGHAARLSFVHQDLGLVLELNTMDNLALHGGFDRGRFGRVQWREQARQARRLLEPFGLELDITSRCPRPRRSSARSSPSRPPSRAGATPAACWCSTSRRRCCRPARWAGCSRSSATSSARRRHPLRVPSARRDLRAVRGGHGAAQRRARRREPVAGLTKGRLVHQMLGVEMEPDYRAPVPEKVERRAAARRERSGRHLSQGHDLHALRGRGARHRRPPRLGTRRAAPAAHRPARARQRRAGPGRVRPRVGRDLEVEGAGRRAPAARSRQGGHRRADDRAGEHVDLGARRVRLAVLAQPSPGEEVRRRLDGQARRGRRRGRQPHPDAERWQPAEGAVRPRAARDPKVLVLCEPTAGVDIGARHAIYDLIAEQVRRA